MSLIEDRNRILPGESGRVVIFFGRTLLLHGGFGMWYTALATVMVATISVDGEEPRFQGRTAVEWAARLADARVIARTEAAFALSRLGPAAAGHVAALAQALTDNEPDVRWYAAMALSEIGPKAESAVPMLAARLVDDNASVRYWAGQALGRIGPSAKSAVGPLIAALSDQDWRVRRSAVFGLRGLGVHAAPAVSALADLLGQIDESERNVSQLVRAEAAEALGGLGLVARPALPALRRTAQADPAENVRQAAKSAVEQISLPATKP